jgi:hypothetical protein
MSAEMLVWMSLSALAFMDSHRDAQSVGLLFAAWPGERARD